MLTPTLEPPQCCGLRTGLMLNHALLIFYSVSIIQLSCINYMITMGLVVEKNCLFILVVLADAHCIYILHPSSEMVHYIPYITSLVVMLQFVHTPRGDTAFHH